jgi:MFS family permease
MPKSDQNQETAPSNKHNQKLFYGWIIVATMAVVGAVVPAMAMLNFGLFIKVMGEDLGIGRSMFGWAMTARQITGAVTGPVVGRLLDRFGSRIMLAIAVFVSAAGMIGLSRISNSWHLLVMFGIIGLMGLGGPGGSMITSVPIFKWFVQNRGKAIAYTALGSPIGALLFIPLTQILITSRGWREAWVILAILGAVIILPLSLIFIRRQPEDMGLLPDGLSDVQTESLNSSPSRVKEVNWTAEEAVHTGTLWKLVIAFSLMNLATGSVGLHRIPAFMDRGLDPQMVSYATAFDALMAGISTFISGMVVRRFSAKYVCLIGFSCLGIATLLTIHAYSFPVMFLSVVFFGFGIGGMMFSNNFLWAEYYGRQNLGSILGIAAPVTVIIGGIGAPLAGYVYDAVGDYGPIWWVSVGLIVLSVIILFTVRAPRKS